nr:hypothetical protein [Streptomyces roseirectus]
MQGRDVLEVAGGDQGRGRVPDDRHQHLGERARVPAGQVRDGEDADAREAEREAGDTAYTQPLGVAEEAGQGDADDRDARDEQAGRRAGEVAFGVGEGEPGADDLDARERQHRHPVRAHHAREAALAEGEGEQEGGAEGAAREHHHGR